MQPATSPDVSKLAKTREIVQKTIRRAPGKLFENAKLQYLKRTDSAAFDQLTYQWWGEKHLRMIFFHFDLLVEVDHSMCGDDRLGLFWTKLKDNHVKSKMDAPRFFLG